MNVEKLMNCPQNLSPALQNLWGQGPDNTPIDKLLAQLKIGSFDSILAAMEKLRETKQNSSDSPDYIIRLCEAIVAESAGYDNRNDWQHLQHIA